MNILGVKLEDYWKAIRHKRGGTSTVLMEDMPLVYTYTYYKTFCFFWPLYSPCFHV